MDLDLNPPGKAAPTGCFTPVLTGTTRKRGANADLRLDRQAGTPSFSAISRLMDKPMPVPGVL